MEKNLKSIAGKSLFWSGVERFSVQGIQFVISILIARLIGSDEYGLIAMLSIFLAVAQTFIDGGFSNALVQKQNRSEEDYSTVFYFNVVISLLFYLLMFLSADAIASFFNEPRLSSITKWVGLNIIVSSFSLVQRARLIVIHDFKTQANASIVSVFLSGLIGVWMAYNGHGVWALVVQTLLYNLLFSIILWIRIKWTPLLKFSIDSFKSLFAFGSNLLVSGLMHTLYVNLYNIVIGKFYSSSQLGFFNRAYTFAQFPSNNLTEIITRAIFPVQCELQSEVGKSKQVFDLYLRFTCFIVFPLMVGLAVLSEPLIVILLKESWLPAAGMLKILSLALLLSPVMTINNSILKVMGRTDYFLHSEIIKKVSAILILACSIPFGLHYICWGMLLCNIVDVIVAIFYARKVLQTGFRSQFRLLLPVVALTSIMFFSVYLVTFIFESNWVRLCLGTFVGTAVYLILAWLFKFKEFGLLVSAIKHKKLI
jgi:teichuronic acid exporter